MYYFGGLGVSFFLFPFSLSRFFLSSEGHEGRSWSSTVGLLCLPLHLEARLGKWMGNSRELSTKMQISE